MSTYLYVDGESHYIMAEKCLKSIFGEEATLGAVIKNPNIASNQEFSHNCNAKFFWDTNLTEAANIAWSRINRAVYFTAFTGTSEDLQESRVSMRDA